MPTYDRIHPDRPLRRAAVAVAVSVGVHALALSLLLAAAVSAAAAVRRAAAAAPKQVTMARLDAAQWERNRTVAKEFVPSAAFDAAPSDARKPDHARFLSDRDRRAERETVAPPSPGMPGRTGPTPAPTPTPPPPLAQEARRATEGEAAKAGEKPPATAGEPLLAPEGVGPRPGVAQPDLQPRPLASRPLVMNFSGLGQGGVPDVDGVAVGNLTVLNAEAWRYATFYDRVGEALYGVWRVEFLPRPPVPSIVARPQGGTARVALGVTLDASGRAVEVTVRRSCGLQDVDALLAELVRKSAPFPNVPRGLLDASGRYSDVWVIALVWGWRGGR